MIFGILTLWVPARWALSSFQVALFTSAMWSIIRWVRSRGAIGWHLVAVLLIAAVLWGLFQIVSHQTVYAWKTWDAVLNWTTNLVAFSMALQIRGAARERFLRIMLIFGFILSILATFTVLTSAPGIAFWRFDLGTDHPVLGPFVYRNQYAAFVEVILPLAIVRAILDRERWLVYTVIAATLFASVVAGGSRAGTILCLAEILITPTIAYGRKMISAATLGKVLAGSIAAVVVLTAVVGWEATWNRLQEQNPYSLRAELVRSSVQMVRERPLTGFGIGTWSDAYPAYARFDDGRFVNQAHNDWIQWAAEGGLPFLAIMLAIAISSVRPALRSLWGIGLLAVFLHCLLDYPMQQRPALAAFFFAMLGLLGD
ncbi:MAG TPA: O-antigen ligase family protein [Bryobacteraceae bacterium]|nr:O-antigen ligase family protein [Bryobacteraceae bacterium]